MTRPDALVQLMAIPDPPELKRGRRYLFAGDASRREVIKRDLAQAYVQYRKEAHDVESEILSVRRSRLHLIRRTA